MSLYESIIRPAAFQFDPEAVHEKAMWALERGLFKARDYKNPKLEQTLFGVSFPNPLGLAAGFDKNAAALNYWHQLGFGFVEVGTITLLAQPGNDRPRMFRLPEEKALINRLGFNNLGASAIATRLASAKPLVPVGVNLGKSKITPLDEAANDYRESFRLLHSFGAYFVVNVSSPNTPGLRTLQERGPLVEILTALKEIDAEKPMFVKVSPDLEISALDEIVEVAHELKLTGLIATNTTIMRNDLDEDPMLEGGLSGRPLKRRSDQLLGHLFNSCEKSMILMGVGGIMNGDDLYEKIKLGARLCQIYTGWIYGGPHMIPEALVRLYELMIRDSVSSLAALRGSGA